MQSRRVGQPYNEGQVSWQERAEYVYSRHGHELRLYLYRPSRQELEAVSVGIVELSLVLEQSVLLMLCRFVPGIPWSAAPYTWWLIPEDERPRVLPPITPDKRAILQVHIIDAATGLLAAVRSVTLSPTFTSTLEAALRQHFTAPPAEATYKAELQSLYQECPEPPLLLPRSAAEFRSGQ